MSNDISAVPALRRPQLPGPEPQLEESVVPDVAPAQPGMALGPPPHPTGAQLRLRQLRLRQRSLGNRAVQRQLAGSVIQRDPAPQTARLGGGSHLVRAGDTLWAIAQQTYGDGNYWREIYRANPGRVGSGGNLILVDSELSLPALDVPVASAAPTSTSAASPAIAPAAPPASTAASTPTTTSPPSSTTTASQPPGASLMSSAGEYLGGVARSCAWPAFRYNLPTIPLATAIERIPGGTLTYTLGWRGNVTVQREGRCLPWSIDQSGLRLEANEIVGQFTSGVRVSGIGSDGMSLGSTFAGELSSSEVRYVPPSTMVFIGQQRAVSFSHNGYRLTGDVGYEMRVQYTPDPPSSSSTAVAAAPAPASAVNWEEVLMVAGGIVLIAGAIALAAGTIAEDVATLGAGVADDPISFAAAAAMLNQGAQMAF